MMRLMALTAALILPTYVAHAEPMQLRPQVGDAYEITMDREYSQLTNDGSSSGSSTDRDTITERVVGMREDGLELEYELPKGATAQDRASNWQFPVRVFKPFHGPLQLINGRELEVRVDRWLKHAKLTRAACGRWIFTWNAFRIQCDPQSVIQTLGQFDLGPSDLHDGTLYRNPKAREPAPLTRRVAGSDGATFIAEMAIDPDVIRHDLAETDVVVAEISGKTLTLDAALRARSTEAISGMIAVTFNTDSTGRVGRRSTVTTWEIKLPNGKSETQTVTEIIERRIIARPNF